MKDRNGIAIVQLHGLRPLWLLLFLLINAVFANNGHSQSPLSIAAPNIIPQLDVQERFLYRDTDILPVIRYLEDPNQSLNIKEASRQPNKAWKSIQSKHIDFGFSKSRFWLKIPVRNSSNQEIKRILDLHSRFMNGIQVYQISNGRTQLLLADSESSPFSNRKINNRYLATEFKLAPHSSATLYIGYWSRGSTTLPISILTEKLYFKEWINANIIIVAFYSSILFMMAFSFFQFLILKNTVQLAYIGYVGAGALYIFHMDGLSFKFLWSDWPLWNAAAALHLGIAINYFAIFFAQSFLDTKNKLPKLHLILFAFLIISAVFMLSAAVVDSRLIKKSAFLLTTVGTLLCAVAGIIAYFRGQKSARFYIVGWLGISACALFATLGHWFQARFSIPATFDFAKLGLFFDALMFALAMADQANEIRKQRDEATQKQNALLKKELQTQKELARLEKRYQSALSLAEEKSHLLANAGHDLRQPIMSLKSAMQTVIDRDSNSADVIAQFKKGFDYIEDLVKTYLAPPSFELDKNRDYATEDIPHSHQAPQKKRTEEVFPIQTIIDNLSVMFQHEAEKKQLILRCVKCSALVHADPLSVMRVLSNLVENAIKFTHQGKVLIGCRLKGSVLEIGVYDTGPGFNTDIKSAFKPYVRGKHSDSTPGLGLGLSIATKLSIEHDYQLALKHSSVHGSSLSIILPISN